jgi:hypothetical protein
MIAPVNDKRLTKEVSSRLPMRIWIEQVQNHDQYRDASEGTNEPQPKLRPLEMAPEVGIKDVSIYHRRL